MAENPEHRAHCHACGHLISGRVRRYRCPKCGSCDVAMIPLPNKESRGDRPPRLDPALPLNRIGPIEYLFPRPPKGVPRAIWAHLRPLRFVVAPLFAVVVMVPGALLASEAYDALRTPRLPPGARARWWGRVDPWIPLALSVPAAGLALSPLLARRRLRRFERDIAADSFERCLECGYPLKGLPDQHRCPECGEAYNLAIVRKTWERYFEAQKRRR